ncbi:DUF86 domain-containing protein [Paracoccus sp. YIM 132242]|uniref:DUF86 domain-containing protein n=1 Tax=Paracoccus lichenicola TaxID=2665644 RepID=A0A6L6HV06_9RHOB|nr:HepT-like ribonuclease domain-containing protein [Paracoccus lichenicola]MTE01118.1 DUF86 domain-containing protein [Paracoccus lichenicola]
MSADNRLSDYILQMVTAAADALTFTEGMAEEDFLADLRTQRAMVMSLMIVGEAASRIVSDHPDFADAKAAIPRRGICGMRNRIYDVVLAPVIYRRHLRRLRRQAPAVSG